MEQIQVEIKLYSYDELEEKPKERAFRDHHIFLCEVEQEGATQEELSETVEDSIRANDYLFFNNGELASCVTYTGDQPKTGITEFKFLGEVYSFKQNGK